MNKQIAYSILLLLSACGSSGPSGPSSSTPSPSIPKPNAATQEELQELNLIAVATQPFFRQATRRDGKKSQRLTATLKIALPENLKLQLASSQASLLIPNKVTCPKLRAKFSNTSSEQTSEMTLSAVDDPKLATQPCLKFIQEVHRAGAVFRFENVATSEASDSIRIPEVTLQIQAQSTLRN